MNDLKRYFDWANDPAVRANSINKEIISFEGHTKWFGAKVNDANTLMLVFVNGNTDIGQLRIDIYPSAKEGVINYSIDMQQRGKGFGAQILMITPAFFTAEFPGYKLKGFVGPENIASLTAFRKAGYHEQSGHTIINGEPYVRFDQ